MASPRRPTIADIAAACGVAKSTVSKVLGHRIYPVEAATRAQVLAAAHTLGYVADPDRRARARRRSGTVALVYGSHLPNVFGVQQFALFGLINRLREHGLQLIMAPIVIPDGGHPLLGATAIDACVVFVEVPTGLDQLVREAGVPVIVLNGFWPHATYNLLPDDALGMRLALEHLADLGHRSVLFQQWLEGDTHPSYAARETAFHAHVARLGLIGSVRRAPAEQLVTEISAGSCASTAVICGNDHDALHMVAACHQTGVAIPDQVSVIAFNDLPHLREVHPALTAVAIPIHDLALAAADALAAISMGHDYQPPADGFPEILTIRASTGPAPRN